MGNQQKEYVNSHNGQEFKLWVVSMVVAIAMVLPLIGLVAYGFSAHGWLVIGCVGLGAMVVLGFVYYVILWSLMKPGAA